MLKFCIVLAPLELGHKVQLQTPADVPPYFALHTEQRTPAIQLRGMG